MPIRKGHILKKEDTMPTKQIEARKQLMDERISASAVVSVSRWALACIAGAKV